MRQGGMRQGRCALFHNVGFRHKIRHSTTRLLSLSTLLSTLYSLLSTLYSSTPQDEGRSTKVLVAGPLGLGSGMGSMVLESPVVG